MESFSIFARNDRLPARLAAGPLEDLIHYHGPEIIAEMEVRSRCNPEFRHLLGGVWESGTPEIWTRIQNVQGKVWCSGADMVLWRSDLIVGPKARPHSPFSHPHPATIRLQQWAITTARDLHDAASRLIAKENAVSTPLKARSVFLILSIVFTAACTTPREHSPPSCQKWNVSGPWSISQSNGFSITFILQQKHDALTGTADNGSGPVPVIGNMHDNQLTMSVSWASGGAGRYAATMNPSGLLIDGFTQNLSMPWSTATWSTAEQFKCAKRSR